MSGSGDRRSSTGRQALLVVDMQNDFVSPKGAMARFGFDLSDVQEIVAPLARLLAAARRRGVPVFHTRMVNDVRRNTPAWTEFWGDPAVTIPGTWGVEFVEPLVPLSGEPVIDKYGYGGFFGTSLDTALRAAEVDTVVVTGTGPNICSGETLHGAFALGYRVVAVSDVLASFSRAGREFNARMRDVALYVIENHYGRVVTSSELMQRWAEEP